jgi:hypothetical protein
MLRNDGNCTCSYTWLWTVEESDDDR